MQNITCHTTDCNEFSMVNLYLDEDHDIEINLLRCSNQSKPHHVIDIDKSLLPNYRDNQNNADKSTANFNANASFKNQINHTDKRILIVEDDKLSQKVISLFLTELRYKNSDIAATGHHALSLLQSNIYDLIFLDIGLPDMDGLSLCKQIRQLSTCTRIPIIAVTAFSNQDIEHQCFTAGVNIVKHKPLSIDELQSTLTDWLA